MKPLTKSVLVGLLAEKDIKTYRALGQNFLIDPNFLKSIPRIAQITPDDYVLEIGAGTGLLTYHLAQASKHVWAVEIDQRLVKVLQGVVKDLPNITLLNENILDTHGLKLNPKVRACLMHKIALNKNNKSIKVVSNLPYAQATNIIINLLESQLPLYHGITPPRQDDTLRIKSMLVMVQWEVAQKLKAVPKTKAYHSISVLLQNLAEVKVVKKVPPHIFWPKPKVYSALISIIPKQSALLSAIYPTLKRVLVTAFRYRRKKILHTLRKLRPEYTEKQWGAWLQEIGLSPAQRPDEISPQRYLALAHKLKTVPS